MSKERALTYSLLAHIRNRSTLVKGPLDIFTPLIKRALSIMNSENVYSGKNLSEVKSYTDKLYNIDFPIPVIKRILLKIAKEVNSEEKKSFILYNDDSFQIKKYLFTEFDEIISSHKHQIENLEQLFKEFCDSSDIKKCDSDSLFKFIEKNKFSLSKYICQSENANGEDFSLEAEFVNFFKKFPPFYEQIKKIYLGALLSSYIEFQPKNAKMDVELLLDTNFILGLIDLNTPESTHTCKTLISIAQSQGYIIRVLSDTIEEIRSLLKVKADYFNESFLVKKVYPEDIYNACDRRNLSRVDLERISDNLEGEFIKYDISVIYDTSKLKNEAKNSEEYLTLKNIRNTDKSALHDAIAIAYVKRKRKKHIYEFGKVNCWFVNNSINRENCDFQNTNGKQPITIKADDLLNILWLSNPTTSNKISLDEVVDIGLSSLVSLTLNDSLPKTQIIQELDDNIHKYAKETLTDVDILRLATRITNKQLSNIQEFNELAKSNKEEFIKRLEKEAKKQKEIDQLRFKKLEEAIVVISKKSKEFDNFKSSYENKSKEYNEKIDLLNSEKKQRDEKINSLEAKLLSEKEKNKKIKQESYIYDTIKKWRKKSWIELSIFSVISGIIIIVMFYFSDWNYLKFTSNIKNFKADIIIGFLLTLVALFFNTYIIKSLYDKYRNHSNIENFKKGIKLPDNLK